MPDLVRVWDSLFAMFADSTKHAAKAVSAAESEARGFLLDLCVAMVLVKRHELLTSSVSTLSSFQLAPVSELQLRIPVLGVSQYASKLYLRGCTHSSYTRMLDPGTSNYLFFDRRRDILVLLSTKLSSTRCWRVFLHHVTECQSTKCSTGSFSRCE